MLAGLLVHACNVALLQMLRKGSQLRISLNYMLLCNPECS